MKKTFITTAAFAALIASPALAKTQGNYVGFNVINTQNDLSPDFTNKGRDNSFGLGVDYKYAFNFNNFFVAPGVFFDYNNHKQGSDDGIGRTNTEIAHTYGVKLNVGYDITNNFALYGTVGHAESRTSLGFDNNTFSDSTEESFVLGLGAKYDINKNISVNASYDTFTEGKTSDLFDTTDPFSNDVEVYRVGLAYNF